ncbi:Pol [Salix suchowensis]|nr:Pol [Salix suchowensis]
MKEKMNIISSSMELIKGSSRTNIMLPKGIKFIIDNALFSTKPRINMLSFKYIRCNEYHIETFNENGIKYIYIISNVSAGKQILKKLLYLQVYTSQV